MLAIQKEHNTFHTHLFVIEEVSPDNKLISTTGRKATEIIADLKTRISKDTLDNMYWFVPADDKSAFDVSSRNVVVYLTKGNNEGYVVRLAMVSADNKISYLAVAKSECSSPEIAKKFHDELWTIVDKECF